MNRRAVLASLLGAPWFCLNLVGCSGSTPVSSGGTPPEESWPDEVKQAEASREAAARQGTTKAGGHP